MLAWLRTTWAALMKRRAHERAPAALSADWRVDGDRTHRVSPIGDVSPGGAFLYTNEPERAGTPLVLEVATPTGWIQVRARVAWAGSKGMGVRFTR